NPARRDRRGSTNCYAKCASQRQSPTGSILPACKCLHTCFAGHHSTVFPTQEFRDTSPAAASKKRSSHRGAATLLVSHAPAPPASCTLPRLCLYRSHETSPHFCKNCRNT